MNLPADSLAVSPELVTLALRAMGHWDFRVHSMAVIATKPDWGGVIWHIETSDGPRSLKLLHRPLARNLFSVAAQNYLAGRGARVPKTVPTTSGDPVAVVDGHTFLTCEWERGLRKAAETEAGLELLCFGLGEFHRLSRGFVPPAEAEFATRLHEWPLVYEEMRRQFDEMEEVAATYPHMPASQAVLEGARQLKGQVDQGIAALARSPYARLAARGEPAWGLAHQDYGFGNGQLGPGGVWVLDLDGVIFDLPIRDLRKLITSSMRDWGGWDLNLLHRMIDAYHRSNPIEPELMEVLLVDLALPNYFHRKVKEALPDPTLLTRDLELLVRRFMEREESKHRVLQSLDLRRWYGG